MSSPERKEHDEESPLLQPNTGTVESLSRKRFAVTAAVVCTLLIGAVMSTKTTPFSGPQENTVTYKTFTSSIDSDGWYIYKVAYPGANGTTTELLEFMAMFSGGSDCSAVGLGCDGYKLTCTYGSTWGTHSVDKELHYVVAPRLKSEAVDDDGLGMDGWIDVFTNSFGDMTKFSAFMHDKLQLFTADVVGKSRELKEAGYSVMTRSGYTSAGQLMGHALVPVGGKIWDFVGPLDQGNADFIPWKEEECPMAHRVELAANEYKKLINNSTNSTWLGVSIATSDVNSDNVATLLTHLNDMTGAVLEDYSSDYCDVKSIHYLNHWENVDGGDSGGRVYIKLVTNKNFQETDSGYSVKQFEDYILKVHERYLERPLDGEKEHRWRGWDHWLDFHVGIKYAGTSQVTSSSPEYSTLKETCIEMATEVNEALLDSQLYVGKRFIQSDGDHYYTGYPGSSMTFEYNTECHYGAEGSTDICTCVSQNSDTWAIEQFGTKYSTCITIYEEEDGHDDVKDLWDDPKTAQPA